MKPTMRGQPRRFIKIFPPLRPEAFNLVGVMRLEVWSLRHQKSPWGPYMVLPVGGWSWWMWCCHRISSVDYVWSTSPGWPRGGKTFAPCDWANSKLMLLVHISRCTLITQSHRRSTSPLQRYCEQRLSTKGSDSFHPPPVHFGMTWLYQITLLQFPPQNEPMQSHFADTAKLLSSILWHILRTKKI